MIFAKSFSLKPKELANILQEKLQNNQDIKSIDIAGAGLDVYNQEPLPQDHKLRFLPNAFLLPHLGYVTVENYSKFYFQMIENLDSCMNNKPIREIK